MSDWRYNNIGFVPFMKHHATFMKILLDTKMR